MAVMNDDESALFVCAANDHDGEDAASDTRRREHKDDADADAGADASAAPHNRSRRDSMRAAGRMSPAAGTCDSGRSAENHGATDTPADTHSSGPAAAAAAPEPQGRGQGQHVTRHTADAATENHARSRKRSLATPPASLSPSSYSSFDSHESTATNDGTNKENDNAAAKKRTKTTNRTCITNITSTRHNIPISCKHGSATRPAPTPPTKLINLILDLDTGSDPHDVLPLLFAACHPRINLKAVTLCPGTDDQISLVRHVLSTLRVRRDKVAIGATHCPTSRHLQNKSADLDVYSRFLHPRRDDRKKKMADGMIRFRGARVKVTLDHDNADGTCQAVTDMSSLSSSSFHDGNDDVVIVRPAANVIRDVSAECKGNVTILTTGSSSSSSLRNLADALALGACVSRWIAASSLSLSSFTTKVGLRGEKTKERAGSRSAIPNRDGRDDDDYDYDYDNEDDDYDYDYDNEEMKGMDERHQNSQGNQNNSDGDDDARTSLATPTATTATATATATATTHILVKLENASDNGRIKRRASARPSQGYLSPPSSYLTTKEQKKDEVEDESLALALARSDRIGRRIFVSNDVGAAAATTSSAVRTITDPRFLGEILEERIGLMRPCRHRSALEWIRRCVIAAAGAETDVGRKGATTNNSKLLNTSAITTTTNAMRLVPKKLVAHSDKRRSSRKLMRGTLALAVVLDENAFVLNEVKLERAGGRGGGGSGGGNGGTWKLERCNGTRTFAPVNYSHDLFLDAILAR